MELKVKEETVIFNKSIDSFLEEFGQNKFIICDKKVYEIYKNVVSNYKVYIVDAVEDNKNINTVLDLCSKLINDGFKKGDLLVAFGGGVLTDIVGFLASIIYRGTPHVFIPTTLLAMVDASIGGKCGVDFNSQKNVLGTIKEPLKILINTRYLASLDKNELLSGFGEIIKYKYLNPKLEIDSNIDHLIYNCLKIKKYYVEKDIYDNSIRMMLNFGHTFGHQIELSKKISHGYAVINGIYLILKLEVDLGIINENFVFDYLNLLKKYNIEVLDLDYRDYIDLIFLDKKNRSGILNLIFVDSNMNVFRYQTTREELDAKLKIK